jgi:hypothetical protein
MARAPPREHGREQADNGERSLHDGGATVARGKLTHCRTSAAGEARWMLGGVDVDRGPGEQPRA